MENSKVAVSTEPVDFVLLLSRLRLDGEPDADGDPWEADDAEDAEALRNLIACAREELKKRMDAKAAGLLAVVQSTQGAF